MNSKDNGVANNIPRWSAPWAAGWSDLSAGTQRIGRDRLPKQPRNSQRRLQVIGFASSSLAATVWAFAIAWLWPVISRAV